MRKLSGDVKVAIERSKIMFCNGYGFDDLSPDLIMAAIDYAVEVKTSIFFDPGPRGKSLSRGSPEEQMALDKFLKMSDVLLLTSDEVPLLISFSSSYFFGICTLIVSCLAMIPSTKCLVCGLNFFDIRLSSGQL